jgi:hypothetical protein
MQQEQKKMSPAQQQNESKIIEKIRTFVNKNPRYVAIWELYLERHRGTQDSTPSRMRRELAEKKELDYPLEELMHFFKDMQDAGAGEWRSGRNGKEGRFTWGFHLVTVAEAVLNKKAPNFRAKDEEKRPLPKGTILAPPERKKPSLPRLPRVLLAEAEPHPMRAAPVSAMTQGAPAAPSPVGRTYRMNLANGEYIDVPLGLSPEEQAELMNWVRLARQSN